MDKITTASNEDLSGGISVDTKSDEKNGAGTDKIADSGGTSKSGDSKSDEKNGTGKDASDDPGGTNKSGDAKSDEKDGTGKDASADPEGKKKSGDAKSDKEDGTGTDASAGPDGKKRKTSFLMEKKNTVAALLKEKKEAAGKKLEEKKNKFVPKVKPTGPIIMGVIALGLMIFDQTTDIVTSNTICNIQCGCLWSIKPNGTVQCEVPGNSREGTEDVWNNTGEACYVTFGNEEMIKVYCNYAKNPNDCEALDPWVPNNVRHPKFCTSSITTILGPNIINSTYLLYCLWLIGDEVLLFLGLTEGSSLLKYFKYIVVVFWFLQILPYTWLVLHLLIVTKIWLSKDEKVTMKELENKKDKNNGEMNWEKRTKRSKLIFTLLEDVPQLILHSIFIINSAITEEHSLVNSGIQMLNVTTCLSLATSSASIAFMLMAYKVRKIEEDMLNKKDAEDKDIVKGNEVSDRLEDKENEVSGKKDEEQIKVVAEDMDKVKDNKVLDPQADKGNEASGKEEEEETGVDMKTKLLIWFPSFIAIGTRALVCSSYASSVVENFKLQTWTLLLPPTVAIGIFIVENLFIQGFTLMANMVKTDFSLGKISNIKETISGRLSFDENGIIKVLSFFFNADSIQSISTSYSYLVFSILLHSVWVSEVTSVHTRIVFVSIQYLALLSFIMNILIIHMEEKKNEVKGWKGKVCCLAYSFLLLLSSIWIYIWLHHPTLFDVYKKLYFPNTDEKTGQIVTYPSLKGAFKQAAEEEVHIDPVTGFHLYNLLSVISFAVVLTLGNAVVVINKLYNQKKFPGSKKSKKSKTEDLEQVELAVIS